MEVVKKYSIEKLLFRSILALILLKLTFSYLNVELDYWLRFLTPNYEKLNPLRLPKNTTEYLEFLIIPSMFLYMLLHNRKIGILFIPLLLTFLMYLLNIATAIYNSISLIDSLKYSLKIAAPIYFFIVLIIHSKINGKNFKKELIIVLGYCLFLALIALLFFDVSFNRGTFRWPVFFSGLHTHNYVLAAVFVGISYLLKNKKWWLFFFLLFSFLFLVVGYNVRTVLVFYLLYIVVALYVTTGFFRYVYAKALLFIPFILAVLLIALRDFDWNAFSSGRLTMYLKKFDILKTYSTKDFLFGRGWGADMVKTTEWWWVEKGSHNDYLTYIVENGIPFTVIFILLILSLLFLSKRASILFTTLILGYLITSMLSNGFAVRALASYVLFMVLAYIYCDNKNFIKENDNFATEKT